MNAILPPVDKLQMLSREKQKLIVNLAIRQSDPLPVRADRIKALPFCTDEVKFQCLKVSKWVNKELYDALFKIYFGEVEKPVELFEPVSNYPQPKKASPEELKDINEASAEIVTVPEKQKRKRLTRVQDEAFMKDYRSGMSYTDLAEKYGITKEQAIRKVISYNYSHKETTAMEETKTITTVEETGTPMPPIIDGNKEKTPKAFAATGKGFISTDGVLKLDEEPVTALLRQKIIETGLRQFYGEIEICIRPTEPVGMIVTVEE